MVYQIKNDVTCSDPLTRTTIEFEILCNDNTLTWIPWKKDIFHTIPYENFCCSHSKLYPLIFTLKDSLTHIKNIKSSPIITVSPHDLVYVDLRSYGSTWYSQLPLPDPDHSLHVVEPLYILGLMLPYLSLMKTGLENNH